MAILKKITMIKSDGAFIHSCKKKRLIFLGVVFAVVFWLVESFLHFYVFRRCSFASAFFFLEPHDIWIHAIVMAMFIIYGIYTQRLMNLRREAEFNRERVLAELEQIFQTAGDGMRVIDKDFNVMRRNDAYLELCGRRQKDDWREKCFNEFPGPLCKTDDCPLRRIMCGEKCIKLEVVKKRSDGYFVPCYETVTPFFAYDGGLIGVVEVFKDVTLLKEHEDEIKRSQERVLAFFKSNPVPCYIWKKLDNDFILENYNDAAYEITRGKIADLVGARYSHFYKDNPSFIEDIWSCFEGKNDIRKEMHYSFKSFAQEKDFIVTYSYISPDSVLVHTEDITSRKEFERAVLDISRFPTENPNPILRLDRDGRLLYLNPAALNLLSEQGRMEEDFLDILPAHVDVLIKVVLRLRIPFVDLEVLIGEKVFAYSLAPFPESGYVNF